mmetsp:Transcript_23122/g.71494  ORF Transcript_23122/g.71494 Transcript_23122/m.71494 type:complete len:698 (+) Transcript_23122:341-2434(+)
MRRARVACKYGHRRATILFKCGQPAHDAHILVAARLCCAFVVLLSDRRLVCTAALLSCAEQLEEERALLMEEGRQHNRLDRAQLEQDVDRRARSVLERVAHGVADDGRLVRIRALAANEACVLRGARLKVLLGVVPRATGVGSADGYLHARHEAAREGASEHFVAEEEANDDRREQDERARGDHLLERRLGGDGHAALVVGLDRAVHQAGVLAELAAHFLHHGQRGLAHALHGHRAEPIGKHRAEDEPRELLGVEDVDRLHARVDGEGAKERERHQRRRADGEALTDRRRRVARGIQRVGALADLLAHAGHLGDAAGVVRDGAVAIDGQAGSQRAQHAQRGTGDAVGSRELVGHVDRQREKRDGHHARLVAQREAEDYVGGRARLARLSDLLHRREAVGGEVLGHQADGQAAPQAGGHTQEDAYAVHRVVGAVDLEGLRRQGEPGQRKGDGRHEDGGDDQLRLERGFDLRDGVAAREGGGGKVREEAHHDAARRNEQREEHGRPHLLLAEARDGGNHERGAGGLSEGAEQIGAHASNVADVVPHVVGDGGGVARVVLGDVLLDLAHEVGANVGSLGVDAAAHAAKERDGGATQAVTGDGLEERAVVVAEIAREGQDGDPQHQQAERGQRKAHDGARAEGHKEAVAHAAASLERRPRVGEDGDLHAQVARYDRGGGAQQEGDGGEGGVSQCRHTIEIG